MTLPPPPIAATKPHSTTAHGHTIDDPWAWLRDPGYPEVTDEAVLAYLREENAYFDAAMQPHDALVETIFQEMKGRLKEDDSSVPQREGDWLYWWAYKPGGQYPLHWRKPVGGSAETLILDEEAESEGKAYWRVAALEVSPDGRLMAWSVDESGAERFTLRIRDLATGADIETVSTVTNGNVAWSADGAVLLYTEVNDNWRSYIAKAHSLGGDPATDKALYEEADEGFRVAVGATRDKAWLQIATGDNQTSEVRLIPAADPFAEPILVSPRQVKRQYAVDSAHGRLWILTNDDHINFRLATADPAAPGAWQTVIAGSDRTYLTGHACFARHVVLSARIEGLDQLILREWGGYAKAPPLQGRGLGWGLSSAATPAELPHPNPSPEGEGLGEEHAVAFPEASYSAGLGNNPEFDQPAYRLSYSSMVTPGTVFDYHPEERRLETLKVQEVPSGYDASLYATERLMAPARDGKAIPVSIVYRKGFPRDGSGKLFLYAYGAYGHAIPPSFSSGRLSLLDRGWAFAIAHIRGGDDLGYDWYLQGKAETRWNTFRDFSDAARGLIAAGFSSPGKIAINGGSAGGELMGVVANTDAHLWGAIVADVPFVDVLNTMQDAGLPLTPGEWPEWGNPITDKAAFELLWCYSPYENVAAQPYPPMLITGGLNDPRVTYWEPAKWAARLRATKTDPNLLLLKINMGAGHGGKSGRYEALRERAESYAFVITQVDPSPVSD
ncbi:oligopeptidase B [Sphingomonas vulcanisoli]|uniref:Oligopeptidase B n=1 Tax=Sphingomonas vulcanisoli TaxID=1658060 RepID=A0ABX0TT93_9SPHN|nr:S9 family peptidase [Sphingomonas vulcanisoli]NIJ07369.1 oligopeptidase B [Sphingomonas vulcanisoli]